MPETPTVWIPSKTEIWTIGRPSIHINLKGLLYVSKAVIPQMIERKSGHIINIGSTAGKEVYPNGNVYCATKHAVDALNKSMKMDLNPYGIRVGAIHPDWCKPNSAKCVSRATKIKRPMFTKDSHPCSRKTLPILSISWFPDPIT